jgi:glutaminyl-tRNA synthetase
MSKRKLLQLVQEKHVAGWNDPRMLTIRGLRRRGYTPEAIRAFCERIGVAKFNSTVEMAWLEDAIREDLNERAPRVMAVLKPLKVVLTNYPEGEVEHVEAANHPQKPELGTRKVPFARELYIETDDFMENARKKFFRLAPGREVRLRYAYFITCNEVVKDKAGNVTELHCTYDPATRGGNAPDGRKVKGTIHWVAAPQAVSAEIRIYDHLFKTEYPDDAPEGKTFLDNINPDSLEIVRHAKLEPSLAAAGRGQHFQFERLGYFFTDLVDSKPGKPVFNRTATLRDTWAKEAAKDKE